jgi:sugar lactone lactonase YvrE
VTNVGNTATLYLDGAAVGSATVTIDTPASSTFYIGRIPGTLGDTRKFDGLVDEVSVYNRALSASEIQAIYNAGSGGKGPIVVNSPSVVDGSGGATTPITFTITRTGSLTGSLTANWTTADDTAVAGTDYVAASGTVTFAAGQTTQTVQVTTLDNNTANPNLDFKLIATPTGGTSITGFGTIVNDEPVLNEIGDVSPFIAAGSGGLSQPKDLVLGPDGNVYVASATTNSVIRYTPAGQLLGTFVAANSGGLSNPKGLAFGPDGNLYVDSVTNNNILEYSGSTGAFLSTYVSSGSGGLNNPSGMVFGQDGNLYVSSVGSQSVDRFQGPLGSAPGSPLPAAGQSGAAFVASGVGGLAGPNELTFGPNGNLFVANGGPVSGVSNNNYGVLEFDATTGGFITTYVASTAGDVPRGIAFDQDGRLYVADSTTNAIHRYDSQGNYLDDPVTSAASSLQTPLGIAFDSQGGLLVSSRDGNDVDRYDRGVTVTLSAASSTPVTVQYTTADGTATAGKDYTAQSGAVTFAPGQTSRLILLVTQAEPVMDGKETFSVQVSSPPGVTLATGTTTETILDPIWPQLSVADASTIEGDTTAHYRGAAAYGAPTNAFNPVTFGPDGNLYTSPGSGPGGNTIERFNGTTGAFMGTFATGPLNGVRTIVFRNGYMYVANEYSNQVLQYDGTTGAYLGVFVTAASGGGLYGMTFGPDGNLYLSGRNSANVVSYNGTTGALIGTFVAAGSGGLNLPEGLTFDPSGSYLYVASSGSNQVLKYNAQTGAYVGVAANANAGMTDVKFGSDGLLYVLTNGTAQVQRFNASGSFVDNYVPAGSGGMSGGQFMTFGPNGDLYVTTTGNNQIFQFGTENEALYTVSLSKAFALPVTVNYATADGTAHAGANYTATSGSLNFAPGVTSQTIRVPILDSGSQTTSLTFTVSLSSPTAATLSRSQATGTIAPSDLAAKFYVVNNPVFGGNRATFKYQASGTEQAPFALSLNHLNPVGIAANAAGTEEWVVDRNGFVDAYNAAGALLGSWTPGGLPSGASLSGVTTDGTNIWLLDATSNKIFYYAGAASRLSGSQNASSSFKVTKADSFPANLVTDGKSIWVVDGGNGKVYKYTVAGSLLGSWATDPASLEPIGITIDPNHVSDIWIVDATTLKVYQYTGAATRTSGKQDAAATFALAAGDSGPMGIADPPPADMLLTSTTASLAVSPPSVPAFNTVIPGDVLSVAAVPSLAGRDAAFATLAREPIQASSSPWIGLLIGGDLAPHTMSPTSIADRAWTPAIASIGQQPINQVSSIASRMERSAPGLLDGALTDEHSLALGAATDLFSAGLMDDAAEE